MIRAYAASSPLDRAEIPRREPGGSAVPLIPDEEVFPSRTWNSSSQERPRAGSRPLESLGVVGSSRQLG